MQIIFAKVLDKAIYICYSVFNSNLLLLRKGDIKVRSWLVELRTSKGLTQQDVSDKVGITRQMISAIENGDADPSVKAAQSLGEALGVPWTRFFEQPDEKPIGEAG